jgi:hypothetical protein
LRVTAERRTIGAIGLVARAAGRRRGWASPAEARLDIEEDPMMTVGSGSYQYVHKR